MSADALWRRRVRPRLREHGWLLIGALWALAVVLGYLGFRAKPATLGGAPSFWDNLYLSLQLFVLQSGAVVPPVPWALEVARLLAPVVLAATAVGAAIAVFREELQLWSVRRMRDHVVVCGLGERGLLLAKAFSRNYPVVAIEDDEQAHGIGEAREEGVIVLIGDATDRTVLRKARVQKARYLVAVGGDDGTNAEVAVDSHTLLAERSGGKFDAFVHVVDSKLCGLLRERETATSRSDAYRLHFFNVFETGARAWLNEHPPFGGPGELGDCQPHLVVVGLGQMGSGLVVGAARSWLTLHPEAVLRPGAALRPRITMIDRAAETKLESLLVHHPLLEEFCELVSCQMDITSPEFERTEFLLDSEGRCSATSIYVCVDDDSYNLAAALTLLRRIGEQPTPVPVVVRMRRDTGLAALLGGTARGVDGLHAFALLDRTCTPEFLLGETTSEVIACAIHDDYVRDQRAKGETRETNSSVVGWDELPESLKESNRRQADHFGVKLRAVGCETEPRGKETEPLFEFSPQEVEAMAKMEHDRWSAERLFEGWTYAPGEKNSARKTSPYLVTWPELSEEIKEFDRNTVRGLPAFLAKADLRVVRAEPEVSDA